ncbi:hypothetical protein [Tenuibacillus multivorans]|uniref:Uncharacterized protein n=1 Tax=Tenuibacillus multivorans TaxID=237069 RepID=A0A1H0ATB1_9BACI|nr:hypothetical protein [Tenuibacillus multivorans]GEL77841.1 hypothetical protein TMU01_20760 [Tenuibacillus multivorans]SDN36353.1 hypothetical protein SAMN05216498_2054 [Tenuibacillus multivorans]
MRESKTISSCEAFLSSWSSAGTSIYNSTRFLKDDLTLVEVMGYTGHAFRININAADVDVAGPTGYDWGSFFSKGLKNIGFTCQSVRTDHHTPPTPNELKEALSLVQTSIDKGVPVITWDLFIPEFGNIYGYDDEKRELMGKDPNGDGPLAYEKLGRGQVNELFVMTLDEPFEVDQKTMLKGALELAIDHAYQNEHANETPPYQNGLVGYDAWIQAFEKGEVSDFGNAYNAVVVYDARKFAAQFFRKIEEEWLDHDVVKSLAGQVAQEYQKVADHLGELVYLFPFPHGGDPNNPKNAQFAIEQLKQAKKYETQATEGLEKMKEVLS